MHLTPVYLQSIEIDRCDNCDGLWFEHKELDYILNTNHPKHQLDETIVNSLGEFKHVTELKCPECVDIQLTAHKIHKYSEIEVDICKSCHGIWVEKDELEQLRTLPEVLTANHEIGKSQHLGHWLFQFLSMLPVEFNIKPKVLPIVTLTLILLNSLIFLIAEYVLSTDKLINWALVPSTFLSAHWFLNLFSYQFLHGNWIHLLGNMYFLFILGDNLEDALGIKLYLLFFIICGVSGGIAETLMTSQSISPVVGASGAIAGIMGGYAVIFRKAKLTFMLVFWQFKLSATWYFSIWLAMNIAGWLSTNEPVAWFAHLGGFMAGLLLAWSFYPVAMERRPILNHINRVL